MYTDIHLFVYIIYINITLHMIHSNYKYMYIV